MWKSTDEIRVEQRRNLWRNLFPTLISTAVALATLVVLAMQVWVMLGQTTIFNRQAGIMAAQAGISQQQTEISFAEQRPWIRMTDIEVSKVDVQSDLVRISLGYVYRNVGHVPANKVLSVAKVIPTPIGRSTPSWDGAFLCNDAKTKKGPDLDFVGGAMFPDQVVSTFPDRNDMNASANNFDIPMKDIVDGVAAVIGSNPPPAQRPVLSRTTFWIVGCVIYKFVGSKDLHGSSFVWVLSAPGPGQQAIDVSKVGVLTGAGLKLTEGSMSAFAD